jgi:putative DNA primase/helicase
MASIDLEKIPPELKRMPNWVSWRPDKTPVNPKTGKNAKANDPATWGTFSQAVRYWEANKGNGIAGIGYEFFRDDPYTGVDLDKCRNPETGELKYCAAAELEYMP